MMKASTFIRYQQFYMAVNGKRHGILLESTKIVHTVQSDRTSQAKE